MKATGVTRAAWAAGAVLSFGAGASYGGAILQPALATTSSSSSRPVSNAVSQAGLETPYQSGFTDFDTYVVETAYPGNISQSWETTAPFPHVVTFDLGGWYDIDGFAVWQYNFDTGVQTYELYTDHDADYDNGGRTRLGGTNGTFEADDTFHYGNAARFEVQHGVRYVHFVARTGYSTGGLQIGEFAFREADPNECAGEALWLAPNNGDPVRGFGSDFSPQGANIGEAVDSVTLASESLVRCVRFWGMYRAGNVPAVDDFTMRVFDPSGASVSGAPFGSVRFVDVTRVRTERVDGSGFHEYEYTARIEPPIYMEAERTYYLSIMNDTVDSPVEWARTNSAVGDGNFQVRVSQASSWLRVGGDLALEIYGRTLAPSDACPTDFTGDGVVNSSDLASLLAAWGACP